MSMVSCLPADRCQVCRVSGPLMDPIDIQTEVSRLEYERLSGDPSGEPSVAIRKQVEVARERLFLRFEGGSGTLSNAGLGPAGVRE